MNYYWLGFWSGVVSSYLFSLIVVMIFLYFAEFKDK